MICWIIVYVRWERLSIIKSYLSIIAPPIRIRGYIWAQGVLQYHLIEVPWDSVIIAPSRRIRPIYKNDTLKEIDIF